MVLKAKANDRRKILALSRDEFRGPRSASSGRFVNVNRGLPPLKRARTELLGPRPSLPRFTDKEQASIDALYNNGIIESWPPVLVLWNTRGVDVHSIWNSCPILFKSKSKGLKEWKLNASRRAASPLVRLVEREEKWEASKHPQGVLLQNWGEIELNHSVTCRVLKATANDRCHLAL
ncbi:hypothetical protein TNCV_736671 [Trichonephila clavipes]|nr:hypothetical protein TNCV_736671 [Trichonephila clavipes]